MKKARKRVRDTFVPKDIMGRVDAQIAAACERIHRNIDNRITDAHATAILITVAHIKTPLDIKSVRGSKPTVAALLTAVGVTL
jgi:hypothetical protein